MSINVFRDALTLRQEQEVDALKRAIESIPDGTVLNSPSGLKLLHEAMCIAGIFRKATTV